MEIITSLLKEGIWISAAITEVNGYPLLLEARVGIDEQKSLESLMLGSQVGADMAWDDYKESQSIIKACENKLKGL